MKGNAEFYTVKKASASHEIDRDGFLYIYISWKVIVFSFITGWGPKIPCQFETLTSSLIMSRVRVNVHVNGLPIFVPQHLFVLWCNLSGWQGNDSWLIWRTITILAFSPRRYSMSLVSHYGVGDVQNFSVVNVQDSQAHRKSEKANARNCLFFDIRQVAFH